MKKELSPVIMEKLYIQALEKFNINPNYHNYISLIYRCDNLLKTGIVRNQIETPYKTFKKINGVWENYWGYIYDKYVANNDDLTKEDTLLLDYLEIKISPNYEEELEYKILQKIDEFFSYKKRIPEKYIMVREHINWIKYLSKRYEYKNNKKILINKVTSTPLNEEMYMEVNKIPNINHYIRPIKKYR